VVVVSTVVVLVRPTAQVDAIVNPKRDLCENMPDKELLRLFNLSEKSFDDIIYQSVSDQFI